jgi:hypothetical protein
MQQRIHPHDFAKGPIGDSPDKQLWLPFTWVAVPIPTSKLPTQERPHISVKYNRLS